MEGHGVFGMQSIKKCFISHFSVLASLHHQGANWKRFHVSLHFKIFAGQGFINLY